MGLERSARKAVAPATFVAGTKHTRCRLHMENIANKCPRCHIYTDILFICSSQIVCTRVSALKKKPKPSLCLPLQPVNQPAPKSCRPKTAFSQLKVSQSHMQAISFLHFFFMSGSFGLDCDEKLTRNNFSAKPSTLLSSLTSDRFRAIM